MTKEEIANIKRIDTSLNVFRKRLSKIADDISKLTKEFNKKIEPLREELATCTSEIDFWQRPVIDRYGKTTEELLRESGEETATDISTEEESEKVEQSDEPDELEKALAAGTDPISEPEVAIETESETNIEEEESPKGLEVGDLPEEWKD